jgi:hypothetical protein
MKTMQLEIIRSYHKLDLSNMNIWIDTPNKKVYVVDDHELAELPLPQ